MDSATWSGRLGGTPTFTIMTFGITTLIIKVTVSEMSLSIRDAQLNNALHYVDMLNVSFYLMLC